MLLRENEAFVVIDGNELQASEIVAMRVRLFRFHENQTMNVCVLLTKYVYQVTFIFCRRHEKIKASKQENIIVSC